MLLTKYSLNLMAQGALSTVKSILPTEVMKINGDKKEYELLVDEYPIVLYSFGVDENHNDYFEIDVDWVVSPSSGSHDEFSTSVRITTVVDVDTQFAGLRIDSLSDSDNGFHISIQNNNGIIPVFSGDKAVLNDWTTTFYHFLHNNVLLVDAAHSPESNNKVETFYLSDSDQNEDSSFEISDNMNAMLTSKYQEDWLKAWDTKLNDLKKNR